MFMTNHWQPKPLAGINHPAAKAAFALTLLLALVMVVPPSAQAQTYTILHNFAGGSDGSDPEAGVTLNQAGNLYGTAFYSHSGSGNGSVFRIKLSNQIFSPLYDFAGGGDGANPFYGVVFGPDGSLYGTTENGGLGFGTVFKLQPPLTICKSVQCPWGKTILYTFGGGSDGAQPQASSHLIFDQAGNIYGTTGFGGQFGQGTVYELTRSGSGWTKTILHSFGASGDGAVPTHNVTFDSDGNLYGTTYVGGNSGDGIIYQLMHSGSGWTENIIASFSRNTTIGGILLAGLIVDPSGNFYGATSSGGTGGGGTIFEMSPSGSGFTFTVLASLDGGYQGGAYGNLVMDSAGNIYGTALNDGAYGYGSVFKLTSPGWTYSSLHDFRYADGSNPTGDLTIDAGGNLYGTTDDGGANGDGVVFEITP
jgi:uncharacterized repeat protein (TIGR03803 family)